METIWTPIQSRKALDCLLKALRKTFRPWRAVLEGRDPTPQERRNAALWPSPDWGPPDGRVLRLGLPGAPEAPEHAFQVATIRFCAAQLGRGKRFPHLDLPMRRCFPIPEANTRVPYYVQDGKEIPLLVDFLWTDEQLWKGKPLPGRLSQFLVDRHGIAKNTSDDRFVGLLRQELVRLDRMVVW